MKNELVNPGFRELSTDEAVKVKGGLFGLPTIGDAIFNSILGIVGIGFSSVTGLIKTEKSTIVNQKAHGILKTISDIGTPIFRLFGF
ncbi:MAG: hypothetical protein LBB94_01985 [Clostridiales bacterium]|nr:hypothetical protein [Clostridiales bacterium]